MTAFGHIVVNSLDSICAAHLYANTSYVCHLCGEKGHFARDCPEKKSGEGSCTNLPVTGGHRDEYALAPVAKEGNILRAPRRFIQALQSRPRHGRDTRVVDGDAFDALLHARSAAHKAADAPKARDTETERRGELF